MDNSTQDYQSARHGQFYFPQDDADEVTHQSLLIL